MTQETSPAAAPTTTPTTATTPENKDTTGPEEKFKYGVIIRGKFIGVEDVKEDHGDEICKNSMIKLKALVEARRGEVRHKQRICVKITLDGVEILDERTNTPMFNHAVTKISYIARDVDDARAIGYIYKNAPNSFQYFAIKTLGQAQELFNTLKELFEVVLEMRTRAKKQQKQQQNEAAAVVKKEEAVASAKEAAASTSESDETKEDILGLEDKIKQMKEQEEEEPPVAAAAAATVSLLDVNSSDPNNLVSSFEDSMNLAAAGTEKDPAKASDELFSLMDPATNAPSPQDNALSMLKAQISNIQAYSVPPPRMAPVVPPTMLAANPFGVATPPVGVAPPAAASAMPNPFGGGGVARGVPLTHFQQPGGMVAPGGGGSGFISPTPNVFSSQIPNPQAAVNPNPNTSQLPW